MFRQASLIPIILVVLVGSCARTTQPTQLAHSTPKAGVTPTPSPTKETRTADTDLSAYAFGGDATYSGISSLPVIVTKRARLQLESLARDKKRGYLVVTITSPDAASVVFLCHVEVLVEVHRSSSAIRQRTTDYRPLTS